MKLKMTPEEFERIVTAYQGGQLREGYVPIGVDVAMAPELVGVEKRFESKGFALTVEEHDEHESLVVLTLKALAPTNSNASTPTTPAAPAPELELVVESPKEG